MKPSRDINSSNSRLFGVKATKLPLQSTQCDNNSEYKKIPLPLFQAITFDHSNIFTFTLLLPEGQAGEAGNLLINRAHSTHHAIKYLSLLS
jgi:hypothetical protein